MALDKPLIFGMREDAGVAIELPGLRGIDPDAEILRLDNMLRGSIAPRIPGVSLRAIPLQPAGVAGYLMAVNPSRFFSHDAYPIDRKELILPDILIEDFACDPAIVLRPAFDAIWNATGWPQSMNYDVLASG